MGEPGIIHTVKFGVTNLEFRGTEANGSVLPLALSRDGGAKRVEVRRLPDYDRTIQHLKLFEEIDATAEIQVDVQTPDELDGVTQDIEDLCYILSTASGTKVNWIYRDQYDQADRLVSRTLSRRVTKPYCGLAIIDPRPGVDLKAFVESAYPIYQTRKAQLGRVLADGTTFDYLGAAVDAYLDAKAEGNFLEVRGAKLVVAMEMLKAAFLGWSDVGLDEYILDPKQLSDLEVRIKKVIKEVVPEPEFSKDRANLYRNIKGLNRYSFENVLDVVFAHLNFSPTPRDLKLFVNSRNKLVHTGLFYAASATDEDSKKCKPLANKVEEFFFLVHFLDCVYLKLVGYSGRYIDWRCVGNPALATLSQLC